MENCRVQLAGFKDCTGCMACHDACRKNAISIQYKEGFAYPFIDSSLCVACGLCEKVCPIISSEPNYLFLSSPRAYYGYSNDEIVRHRSSSGGISYELNRAFINAGGVVYGVAFNDNRQLKYLRAETLGEIQKFVGSKYLQASSDGVYCSVKNDIRQGKKILFTGLPCVISGLRSFLNKEELDKVTFVKIICHGIASPTIYNSLCKYLEEKYDSKIIDYNFRSKIHGWGRMSVCITYENGKITNELALNNIHHYWFSNHWNMRLSCFNCLHRTVNEGDLIIGDWWGVDDYKTKLNKKEGISVIIANTNKGETLLKMCDNNIDLTAITIDEAISRQSPLKSNPKIPSEREEFLNDFFSKDIKSVVTKYQRKRSFKEKLKKVIFSALFKYKHIRK